MSAAPEPEVVIPPGTVVLDKYRVVDQIGVGGMGLVVQATHNSLGTSVAIKFLLPQYASSTEAGRRFVNEAKAASKIASEHIVRVFDAGTSQPYGPYIVMEYLNGHDLARHLRQNGPCSIEAALDFTVQAALALAEAHANGIVHRDVKPANLFLVEQPDGAQLLKVLDFGISKVVEDSALDVTKTTAILGSGLYMSPEQMKSSKTVDHRTDVYALGISLFELLARTQPFTADSFAELAIKVNMEPPTDIRAYRPDVSPELAEAISRAYAKKADERYQSMGEFALALEPWCGSRTRPKVEALARTETRRGRAPSMTPLATGALGPAGVTSHTDASRAGGSYPPPQAPPPLMGSQLRFPRPPSLPTASSMGMDTFGLSKKSGKDSLGVTADPALIPKNEGASMLLGVGAGVGAVLALGVAAFWWVSSGRTPAGGGSALAGSTTVASADARRDDDSNVVVAPGSALPFASGAKVGPSALLSGTSLTKSGQPRSAVSASAMASAVASASSVPPPPASVTANPTVSAPISPTETSPPPPAVSAPCRIRDLDGTLRDCPKN